VTKYHSVCLWIVFLSPRTWRQLSPGHCLQTPDPTPYFPVKDISPVQSKVLWTEDRDEIRPQNSKQLANNTGLVVQSLYFPSTQDLIKKPCMKSRCIVKSHSPVVRSLATAHHYITWHLGTGDEHFLARLMLFYMFNGIFSISVMSFILVIRLTSQRCSVSIELMFSCVM